jgi:hypothetical protein
MSMPLLDHFHPPLSEERHWEALHAAWAGSLADDLNRRLPEGYFAEEFSHAGGVEVDVPTFEEVGRMPAPRGNGEERTATLTESVWAPPAPALSVAAVFTDDFEVKVISTTTGPRLVAAIELVSPRNKDRPDARRAFAVKCASYLYQGISLIVADIVTGRRSNLHNQIMGLLKAATAARWQTQVSLYAVAYRPVRRDDHDEVDLWREQLTVGGNLPVLPLGLDGGRVLPVDLEAAYMDARKRRRLA